MGINLPILIVGIVLAAIFVFLDAKRRHDRREALEDAKKRATDDEDEEDGWEDPRPVPSAIAVLFLLPIALPVYFIRTKRFPQAGAALLYAAVTIGLTLGAPSTTILESPFALPPPIRSRIPPGLSKATRKVIEELPPTLGDPLVDALPLLIDLGKSNEDGADITVVPAPDEARVVMRLKEQGYDVALALRFFASAKQAKAARATEAKDHADLRNLDLVGRHVEVAGPSQDGDDPKRMKLDLLELRQAALTHLLVAGPANAAKIEQVAQSLADRLVPAAASGAGGGATSTATGSVTQP